MTLLRIVAIPFAIGLLSSSVAVHIQRHNLPWALIYLPSTLLTTYWLYLIRQPGFSILQGSVFFDVSFSLAYLLGLLIAGQEVFALRQILGVLISIVGVALVS